MPFDVFLSALLFVFVGSFTPGPNNAMLMASGVNYGFRRTVPHIAGVTIGYAIMFAAVALGLGRLFTVEPRLYLALKIAGSIYLIWLAWRIAHSGAPPDGEEAAPPQTLMQAALFQWVNPKGVMMAVTAAANFLDPAALEDGLPILLSLKMAMSVASASTWAMFGQWLRHWLENEARLRLFNRVMALALVASLWPLVSGGLPAH